MRKLNEALRLTTDKPDVTLREFSNLQDDKAYYELINANRSHLSQYGDATSRKYPTLESVIDARKNADDKLRMGIWHDETDLVGTVNATPDDTGTAAELGYLLRADATGNGYATIALRAFVNYIKPRFARVFAEVHEMNMPSIAVMQRVGFEEAARVKRDWGPAIIFEPKI